MAYLYQNNPIMWTQQRKRTYVYWFNFLKAAETSSSHVVSWKKYEGWGGPKVILEQKFDDWWSDRWVKLFGYVSEKEAASTTRFRINITRDAEYEKIRLAQLVYSLRDTPIEWMPKKPKLRFHGRKQGSGMSVDPRKPVETQAKNATNSLSIAARLYHQEIAKKRHTRIAHLNPDDGMNVINNIQGAIKKHQRDAMNILISVCDGQFP
jgi:hypothetical protein